MALSTEMNNSDYSEINITEEIRGQWKWLFAGGIISVVLGLLAIIFPMVASVTISIFLGWILVIAGVAQSAHAFRVNKWKGFLLTMLGGIVAIVIGALMLLYPAGGVAALTLFVAGFLLASGVIRSVAAFQIKPNDLWGWLLSSGILAIILGLLVIFQFPFSAAWFIGLLVGLDLLFAGIWLMMVAWTARKFGTA
ncbi:MAG: HdeD family acid-resistance protein [Gammaproteobacteria bacterium]|jgi:uncharacterized membrane protein HdeD (DUF308 family)